VERPCVNLAQQPRAERVSWKRQRRAQFHFSPRAPRRQAIFRVPLLSYSAARFISG
jgi:hypothetical protein